MTDLPLQVDVNEWWTVDEALDACDQLAALGVEYVEQPLREGDPGGSSAAARIPIYVDEDCHTLSDVAACREVAHGINIKLAKSGGVREAFRMAHAARALGLGVMLGCMVESGLGIAAGCAVAPLCDHVDLDGNLLLAHDPAPGPELRDGVQVPSRSPALAAGERTLILAEGFSADRHYGKTMHGLLRYRREDVVTILDSVRAGEQEAGVPIVGDVDAALAFDPQVALVGVATQGRFPPAWRALLRACIEHGLAIESGLHEMLADDPELRPLADRVGVDLRDLRRPPSGLDCPTGANLEVDARIVLTVGSDCAIGKMTVSLELDRAARRGDRLGLRPDGTDRDRDRGLGDGSRRGRRRLPRGRCRATRRRGPPPWGRAAVRRGPGLARAPGVLRGHARALPRVGAARPRPLPSRRLDGDRRLPGHPIPPLAHLVELHEQASLPRRRARVVAVAVNTAGLDDADARTAIARRRQRRACPRATRCETERTPSSTPCSTRPRDAVASRAADGGACGVVTRGESAAGEIGEGERRLRSFAVAVVGALVCTGAAWGADVGANDDTGKYEPDAGAAFYDQMASLGLRQTVVTVRWQPSDPLALGERPLLDLTVAAARRAGRGVVFATYPYRRARSRAASRAREVRRLARGTGGTISRGQQFVVGNEPNQPAFWRPQFWRAKQRSARAFGPFLAAGYDALKAVDSDVTVVGVGLSPRGNDRPLARSNVSTSPVRFLAALGAWYRSSGREPLMDGLSFHPYPNRATDPWPAAAHGRTRASSTSIVSSRRSGMPSREPASPRPARGSGSTSTRSAGRWTLPRTRATTASRTSR